MAENDIYNSKVKYEKAIQNLDNLLRPVSEKQKGQRGKRHYQCRVPKNIGYIKKLAKKFDAKDLSYVRRLRVINSFKIVLDQAEKDLKDLDRDDIDSIMGFMHKRYLSVKSKKNFIADIKHCWKLLFPELDEKGRKDETITPYVVRHLSGKIDKSKEKKRNDKLDPNEFTNLVNYFSHDPRIQCYLMMAIESLARPQELLYLKLHRDIELYDGYAKATVSEHGKEGTKLLHVYDAYPYMKKWVENHPLKGSQDAFLFVNQGRNGKYENRQLTPFNINKKLREATKVLKIRKKITCYSLKRNGVTWDLLSGKNPQDVQKKAGWTSLKQLETYSKMTQEDVFILEGIKKGRITDKKLISAYKPFLEGLRFREGKVCECGAVAGFEQVICPKCNKSLSDNQKIEEQIKENKKLNSEMEVMRQEMEQMKATMQLSQAQSKEEMRSMIMEMLSAVQKP